MQAVGHHGLVVHVCSTPKKGLISGKPHPPGYSLCDIQPDDMWCGMQAARTSWPCLLEVVVRNTYPAESMSSGDKTGTA
jgi:hypothetical protein